MHNAKETAEREEVKQGEERGAGVDAAWAGLLACLLACLLAVLAGLGKPG